MQNNICNKCIQVIKLICLLVVFNRFFKLEFGVLLEGCGTPLHGL